MPKAIADFFIQKAYEESEISQSISLLKLHKLLYYSYVWHLVLKNKKLFDEPIEACKQGPVVLSQWIRFKQYERQTIPIEAIENPPDFINKDLKEYLRVIWLAYGQFSAESLSKRVLDEKLWQKSFNQPGNKKIILEEDIQKFYHLDRANIVLPENVAIRQKEDQWEMFFLNQATKEAIFESFIYKITDDK